MTKLLNHINTYQSEADYQNDKSKNFPNVSYIIENDNVLFEVYRYEKQYFAIESLEDDNAIMFKLSSESGSPSASSAKTISVSTDDGVTWTDYTSTADGTTIATLNIGQKILIKGNNDTYNVVSDYIGNFSCFTASKQIDVNGNIMSLIYGDNFKGQYSFPSGTFNFYNIFNSAPIVSAENLILPATTLATACYKNMFKGCTGLTTAPELPATTLANSCYQNMFDGCTGLTTAPALPATTLASGCYESMFFGCTSLKTAPSVLPATTLADYCYQYMFYGCTGLVNAPTLPATTLANSCYDFMFSGCTGLTTAPELPATILAYSCYSQMFYGCTNLTTAPTLPSTTLATKCYQEMFYDCTGLTTAPSVLPATTLAEGCYQNMFWGCTRLVTAPELPATTLAYYCYTGMFNGCTSLKTAPSVLPATILASSCYNGMFQGCTSLKTAPALPATTLESWCCKSMFQGCTKLSYIKCLATDISATNCTLDWVDGVASTGTFVKDANMTSWTTGTSGIPNGWTVVTE